VNRPSTTRSHRLRSLAITGGFLDGTEIEFSNGLNCLIGGRGTGKTTILELIRYALDLDPLDARKHKTLIDSNLGGGRVRLTVETKEGLTYIISRTANEAPIVLDSKGNPTDITLSANGIFSADVFGQNHVEGIADDPVSQLALIDNFDAETIRKDDGEIERVLSLLASNARQCVEAQKIIGGLADELGTLGGLESKLKEMKVGTGQDAKVVDAAHQEKAQRDREKRALGAAGELLRDFRLVTEELVGRLGKDLSNVFDKEAVAGKNVKPMEELRNRLRDYGREIDQLLKEAVSRTDAAQATVSETEGKMALLHREQDMAFSKLIEKHKEAMGISAERSALEKKRNELLENKKKHDQQTKHLNKLVKDRADLLTRLSELRNHRFAVRKAIEEKINTQVSPQIRVRVEQFGNTQEYQKLLEAALKGASINHKQVAGKIAGRMSPTDFAEAIRQGDVDTIVNRSDINPDQARKVVSALSGDPILYQFETVELIDLPSIELRDGGEYKNSLTLSTGQKCTSILPILLLDSEKPLLVDQPEDNLDNRFVYEVVVQRIREVKKSRQLLFITHNPNVPVLGEAERVFVLTSTGQAGEVANSGTVEDCKKDIVTLLEGGEEAFKERKRRYDY